MSNSASPQVKRTYAVMRLALYQPDIPQNTGTILRLAACLGIGVDVIGPTGFDMTDRALRRSGLDYIDKINICRHLSWEDFQIVTGLNGVAAAPPIGQEHVQRTGKNPARVVLLTTKSACSYLDFSFRPDDRLLLGRESAGVPRYVHQSVNARITIPLKPGFRSLNIAVSAAMVLGEALRQTNGFTPVHDE